MDARDTTPMISAATRTLASPIWRRITLVGLGLLVFGVNLGGTRLWDVDEAIFSQAAVEMMQRGDLVTPSYNGQLFAHKPPLMYWCQIAAYQIFGTTEFAARLFSALFCIGTLLVTYELGRILFNERTGFWAGIVLGGCVNFVIIARAATPDAHLTFFCTSALLILVRGSRTHPNEPWRPRLPVNWSTYAIAYACMALATLVKGPVGIVIPMAVWGMFLLIEQYVAGRSQKVSGLVEPTIQSTAAQSIWRRGFGWSVWFLRLFWPPNFLLTVWRMRPITAIITVLLVAGPWYYLVGLRTNGEFLREFFLVQNLGRAAQVMESHRGPFFYYLVAVCIGTFPWCVLLWPALKHISRSIRSDAPERAGLVLISCWICVWIGCFSLVATKLSSYVVPAYPAIALGFAAFVDHCLKQRECHGLICPMWLRSAWRTIGIVGILWLIALPVLTRMLLDGELFPLTVGLIPLLAAVIGWRFSERGKFHQSMVTLAVLGVMFNVATFSFAVMPIDAHKNTHLFAASIHENSQGTPHVATYKYSPPSLVFYSQIAFKRLRSRHDVSEHFQEFPEDVFLLTTEKQFAAMAADLPTDLVVLRTERLFLKQENVVLLCRRPTQNDAQHANAISLR